MVQTSTRVRLYKVLLLVLMYFIRAKVIKICTIFHFQVCHHLTIIEDKYESEEILHGGYSSNDFVVDKMR